MSGRVVDIGRRPLVLLASGLVVACTGPPPVPSGPVPAPRPPAGEAPPPAAEGVPVGLPPIPLVDGLLEIRVVHPSPGTLRPRSDSVLVYGSVGTGRAELSVGGAPVVVAANGAFIARVARPADDTLRFVARAGGRTVEHALAYSAPVENAGGARDRPPPPTVEFATARGGIVVGGADTLATGSDVAIGRPSPGGGYRWFLPRGARLAVTAERGNMVRARLDATTEAWFSAEDLRLEDAAPGIVPMGTPYLAPGDGWTDVRMAVDGAPFRAVPMDSVLEVTIHGVSTGYLRVESPDEVVRLVEVYPDASDVATLRIHPSRRIWGFKAFYEPGGTLVIRVRRGPEVDPENVFRGVRVAVDPGHPPAGATGPTGLAEADANLGVAVRLAEELRARGAEVLLTRETRGPLGLAERVDAAVAWGADVLISVHNNAFPEGADPHARSGTSTYHFHPFAAGLAEAINAEIVALAGTRDLGALWGNLALARPTWMPSVLTESLFMPIPEHEAALRDPIFLQRLAVAHVRGLERFLREWSSVPRR